jgi:hypothetical protein
MSQEEKCSLAVVMAVTAFDVDEKDQGVRDDLIATGMSLSR